MYTIQTAILVVCLTHLQRHIFCYFPFYSIWQYSQVLCFRLLQKILPVAISSYHLISHMFFQLPLWKLFFSLWYSSVTYDTTVCNFPFVSFLSYVWGEIQKDREPLRILAFHPFPELCYVSLSLWIQNSRAETILPTKYAVQQNIHPFCSFIHNYSASWFY